MSIYKMVQPGRVELPCCIIYLQPYTCLSLIIRLSLVEHHLEVEDSCFSLLLRPSSSQQQADGRAFYSIYLRQQIKRVATQATATSLLRLTLRNDVLARFLLAFIFSNGYYTETLDSVHAGCIYTIQQNPVRPHKDRKRVGARCLGTGTGNTFGYFILSQQLRLFRQE